MFTMYIIKSKPRPRLWRMLTVECPHSLALWFGIWWSLSCAVVHEKTVTMSENYQRSLPISRYLSPPLVSTHVTPRTHTLLCIFFDGFPHFSVSEPLSTSFNTVNRVWGDEDTCLKHFQILIQSKQQCLRMTAAVAGERLRGLQSADNRIEGTQLSFVTTQLWVTDWLTHSEAN